MNEFLPQLKKLSPIAAGKNNKSMRGKEIFFMLKAGDNDVYIIPIDKELQPVETDFHYFSGDTAQLLRSLNSIKEDMAFNISWDDNDTEDISVSAEQRIVLSDPNIRKYILKAEDYHILVEQDNYKKFCDILKKYVYLL